jgi:UDP-N-acetylmuramoylalanine--D-glutamate ligase
MKLNLLKNKKILILGLGREGESSFQFLRKQFPKKIIGLADKLTFNKLPLSIQRLIKKDKKIKLFLGGKYLESIKNYDIVIKTPGISRKLLLPYLAKQKITSQTEIFLEKYKNQTIGITGTKGKGTTANLIYKIFKDNKIEAEMIGNMGKPALDFWKNKKTKKLFIFELSSHQLENLKISPHIAIFLNIYPDHLDYFKDFKEYFKAKTNITKWQKENDYFIFNDSFSEIKNLAKKSKAKKIRFETKKSKDYFLCNKLASKAVSSLFKISSENIKKSEINLKTIEHRLEFVGKFNGIYFYNDSAATIPEATIAALNFLKNVETLILGGSEKGSDFQTLTKTMINKKIKTVILFPEKGKKMWQEISKQGKKNLPEHFFVNKMDEAVRLCFKQARKGSACLLSPACASFTSFENYQDRGNQFKKYIKEFAKK